MNPSNNSVVIPLRSDEAVSQKIVMDQVHSRFGPDPILKQFQVHRYVLSPWSKIQMDNRVPPNSDYSVEV